MDTDSRYPMEYVRIDNNKVEWNFQYSATEIDMVSRVMTAEEQEAYDKAVNFSEV